VLKAANSHAKFCYERALEARERALKTDDPSARDEILASEVRWLKLGAEPRVFRAADPVS
jgi:hypothetical protein